MAGLLDLLTAPSGGGGGLLDFLRNNALNQQPTGGLASDQAQYGPSSLNAYAQMVPILPTGASPTPPSNIVAPTGNPAPQPQQPVQVSPQASGNPGGLGAGVSGFFNNLHTGPLGAVIGGVGSALGLEDPKLAAQRLQANNTANFLRARGAPEADIIAAVGSGRAPGSPEVLKKLIDVYANREKVRPATAEERKAFGAPEDLPMAIDTTTNKPIYGPAGQKTNVSLNTVANPVLEGVGKQIVAQRDKAQNAATSVIPFVHEARQALDEGAITGAFADQRVFAQKVGGLFGLSTDQAANTEKFRAAIGNEVLGHIKSLGANPSNADRDYIEKIQGGQITLDEKSLRYILDMTEKYARQAINNFNSDAQKLIQAKPENYNDIAPLMSFPQPAEYKFKPPAQPSQQPALAPVPAATPNASGWTDIGGGVKIRAK